VRGVFTDIDDTLTTEGAITPEALAALAALQAAGLPVIAVTGRPVGWSEPFARDWPVQAIVAENGAVALVREQAMRAHSVASPADAPGSSPTSGQTIKKLYLQGSATREGNFARMQEVARRIVAEVPGATRARDSAGRETDIAIDHSEFSHLPASAIRRVVATMQAAGMQATVSSIHINGWFGEHDKLAGARWILRTLTGRILDAEIEHWAYIGDSTNDQRMFERFPQSVGVANIARFVPQLTHLPRSTPRGSRACGQAGKANRPPNYETHRRLIHHQSSFIHKT
jgi:HAD superfamily hydrolase (TIGR01484 family)